MLLAGLVPRTFVTNNSALATRTSGRVTASLQLPLYGLPKKSFGNAAIAVFAFSAYTRAPASIVPAEFPSLAEHVTADCAAARGVSVTLFALAVAVAFTSAAAAQSAVTCSASDGNSAGTI